MYPDIDDTAFQEHLVRFGEEYPSYFSDVEICEHIGFIRRINSIKPVWVTCDERDGDITVTIIGYDHPGVLSLITGILSSLGFQINSGMIFSSKTREPSGPFSRSIIIDRFIGRVRGEIFSPLWSGELQIHIEKIYSLLEKADMESIDAARETVHEMVAEKLPKLSSIDRDYNPIMIDILNDASEYTVVRVKGMDTPFFLYTMASSFFFQGIDIRKVVIRTVDRQAVDEFGIVDRSGRAIRDAASLERIKFSALLTKRFTYAIGSAPDPYSALSRFEQLIADIVLLPQKEEWNEYITDPRLMKDLARLLGTSTFLWEDVIRQQYETIITLLREGSGKNYAEPAETAASRLALILGKCRDYPEKISALNEFKDRELFLIDLDHILNPSIDFHSFSVELTHLAEAVIGAALDCAATRLKEIYGNPRTVAGLDVQFNVLGLGKLGGAALGYASDLEVMFVYGDSGDTDGPKQISNSEFFERLVQEFISVIHAKKEGIFDLDLRLRPYGSDGPLAVSLEAFCRYYGQGGDAHSYERLALVRMRPIYGDKDLGERLMRFRDEFVYRIDSIIIADIRDLRERQYQELSAGRVNAKFSPGSLVDVEYTVQLLQVQYGHVNPEFRTPRIHEALSVLEKAGVLTGTEVEEIRDAYEFLRRLINGLRMLRGSARDLFLPPIASHEFSHLARRMGYTGNAGMTPAQELHTEFDTRTAVVRRFINVHFGMDRFGWSDSGNFADLVISGSDIDTRRTATILTQYGFRGIERAAHNIKQLVSRSGIQGRFARLSVLASDFLKRTADPDMALNNWERFTEASAEPDVHFEAMLAQPRKLEILISIFAASQYLSDILIRNPGFLEWLLDPENLYRPLRKEAIVRELTDNVKGIGYGEWLNRIRVIKKREILRIGARDISLGMPLENVIKDLSVLAESCIEACIVHVADMMGMQPDYKFAVMAFGKLGGSELNYSSDLDLMILEAGMGGATDAGNAYRKPNHASLMEQVASDLSVQTDEGHAYRVDLRLRPYGSAGQLVNSVDSLITYYSKVAGLWEIQALLKLRPVAGSPILGGLCMERLRPLLSTKRRPAEIATSIRRLRDAAVRELSKGLPGGFDVKNGIGGIRDIEFMTQGLQLAHIHERPALFEGNTLMAIMLLRDARLFSPDIAEALREDYCFLRKIEHFLQLYEDRQVHSLPEDPDELRALARRVLAGGASANEFMVKLDICRERIRRIFDKTMDLIEQQ